jgi:hypothetical protein
MEFLYDFMELEEYTNMKEDWLDQGYDPVILLWPEKVEIWLFPPE